VEACPFNALVLNENSVEVNELCRACGICVKKCPVQAIRLGQRKAKDLSAWKGILVYGEYVSGKLHPVTIELIGKGSELADKSGVPLYVVIAGYDCQASAKAILSYPVSKVLVYDHVELEYFRSDVYADVLEDAIHYLKPAAVLIGATPLGRSLAPRAAVRFRTGLTADCTFLDIKPDGSLIQIRPAFGGNIMAEIVTPYTRPQFSTVRYKVMEEAKVKPIGGTVENRNLKTLISQIKIIELIKKESKKDIVDSERIVVAGKGVKSKHDMHLIKAFAESIGAEIAGTRPIIENGWVEANRQIGLSGRTVKPKLIITCGVSGAVQFIAGMKAADCVVAVNTDRAAPIFQVADYAVVGDLYSVIPQLQEVLKKGKGVPDNEF